jgi:membrane protease subunit (stomatin/prohibitin family)
MQGIRSVISTLTQDGKEIMGPGVLAWHYPDNSIVNNSLLTVESNHFCVLKARGAILSVYDTGQYPVTTPDRPILGSFTQAFFGGQSPWQYEALYINRAKMVVKAKGLALSSEMAEMTYEVDYYFNVATKDDALALVTHMPISEHTITAKQVNEYATPVVEQAINQVVQVTPLERVNEKIHEIGETVHGHLQDFLKLFGITLDTVKVLIYPRDEMMRALISLRAFGLQEIEAVRYYVARLMAERGVLSAPNMAVGEPFHIGAPVQATVPVADIGGRGTAADA